MLNKRCYRLPFGVLLAFFMLPIVHAQSEWSMKAGVNYNGGFSGMDVLGGAVVAAFEYKPAKDHFFSVDFRTKYGEYWFNDGTEWGSSPVWNGDGYLNDNEPTIPPLNKNEARVKYSVFTPQIGLAPKFHLRSSKPLSLFLENEFDIGLMTGKIRYMGFDERKKITEPIYCYSVGVGLEYECNRGNGGPHLILSMGYSTLNFNDNIKKHQPVGYNEKIPNQHTPFYMNIIFKFSLNNN